MAASKMMENAEKLKMHTFKHLEGGKENRRKKIKLENEKTRKASKTVKL